MLNNNNTAGTGNGATGVSNTLNKIQSFEKFGSILGLERINVLLDLLGNPHKELKVIHVAGTNGKGSTCRYIYSVLQEAGYKVGLYTSPFLEVFNERIEACGKYISDEALAKLTDRVLEKVKVMTDSGYQSPTEFEVITAVAFLYYKEQNCDYVVLEVGLGGRGDSTNVIEKPLISVITSISKDHTDRLGNTIAEIAGEKAGIIKEKCPVVTSCEDEEGLEVIRDTAVKMGCQYFETKNIGYEIMESSLSGYTFDVTETGMRFNKLKISMLGDHQIKNAMAALKTLMVLRENGSIEITDESIYAGFKRARHIGRLEVMSKAPLIIIDGAHNEDGARALSKAIGKYCEGKNMLFVTGILADKDVESVLKHFTAVSTHFVVTEPDSPRKMKAEDLALELSKFGAQCSICSDPAEACDLAIELAKDFDGIVFAGSLYLIGAVRGELRKKVCHEV